MSPGEVFSLRMELSAADIPWRAVYPNGERVPFPTISESGIRSLIIDYPQADRTGILVDGKIVLVAGLDEAKAALAPPAVPIESDIQEAVAVTPPAPAPRTIIKLPKAKAPITAERRAKDSARKRAKRRLDGRQARADWLAGHTVGRDKPWLQTNQSRSAWYRHRQVRCNDSDVKSG
jgi:hypothetical protein